MTANTLLYLVGVVIIIGILVWVVMALPIDAMFKRIIYGLVAIFVVLWLLGALSGHPILVLGH